MSSSLPLQKLSGGCSHGPNGFTNLNARYTSPWFTKCSNCIKDGAFELKRDTKWDKR